MNEERKLETATCSRCGGTGHHSYNQLTGTVCFKCNGAKIVYTKRGRAAADFLHALRCKPAGEVKVGDLVQAEFGIPLPGRSMVKTFARVAKVGWSNENGGLGGYYKDGVLKPYWVIELEHPKHGKLGLHTFVDQQVRMGWTGEQKAEQLKQALDYQDTLGKNGKPSSKALKALQGAVAKEVIDKVLSEEAA